MKEVHYLVGHTCNLSCPFCIHPYILGAVSFEFQKKIIDQIYAAWISTITLSGWEPLVIPHIIDVLQYIHDKGMTCILHTNGVLLTKELIFRMKWLVSRISLTLDSTDEEILAMIRTNRHLFKHTINCIHWAAEAKIPVSVKTLITKYNKDDLHNIAKYIEQLPIEYWTLIPFLPIERGISHKDRFYMENQEVEQCIKSLKGTFPNIPIKDHLEYSENTYCFIYANWEVHTNKTTWEKLQIGKLPDMNLQEIISAHFL